MVDCTPDPNLLESMRSVGYSLNTAVADIIDNSIAAHAKPSASATSTTAKIRMWQSLMTVTAWTMRRP